MVVAMTAVMIILMLLSIPTAIILCTLPSRILRRERERIINTHTTLTPTTKVADKSNNNHE